MGDYVRVEAEEVMSPSPAFAGPQAVRPIPDARRLSEAEQATAGRLMDRFPDRTFRESDHIGAEYVDVDGRTYDALGTPGASQYWNPKKFLESIESHLRTSNDFTVLDLTGFKSDQIAAVRDYVDRLPAAQQQKIIRIGF